VVGPRAVTHSSPIELTPAVLSRLTGGTARCFFWGWVEYDDVFDGTPRHRTEFCFEIVAKAQPETGALMPEFSIWGPFNGMDDDCLRSSAPPPKRESRASFPGLPLRTVDPGQASEVASASLNALLVTLHRSRLDSLGLEGSGLHSHYALLLERREIVAPRHVATVDLVLRVLPEFQTYHVLRAGLGEVAFLLSAFGRRTLAFDPFL